MENRHDGVSYETQKPIPFGAQFTYRLQFPDPGLYWYHPHVREDCGQEMGLYGQIIVDPGDADYWQPPVHREIPLTLDDILVTETGVSAFHRYGPTHNMMGRYGTVLLVNGETEPSFTVARGEVIRLYLTNTANTRIFNVAITGATLKLGGDSGRHEHEEIVDSVMIAPSERAIVDVLFDTPGTAVLQHRTPEQPSTLATFTVTASAVETSFTDTYRNQSAPRDVAALTGAHVGPAVAGTRSGGGGVTAGQGSDAAGRDGSS